MVPPWAPWDFLDNFEVAARTNKKFNEFKKTPNFAAHVATLAAIYDPQTKELMKKNEDHRQNQVD
jgi:hypothetical protein